MAGTFYPSSSSGFLSFIGGCLYSRIGDGDGDGSDLFGTEYPEEFSECSDSGMIYLCSSIDDCADSLFSGSSSMR